MDNSATTVNSIEQLSTPLSGRSFEATGVAITEQPACGKLTLRGDFSDDAIAAVISDKTGCKIPLAANTFGRSDTSTLYWMAPDELLLHRREPFAGELLRELRSAMPAGRSSVVDVSDYYTVLHISGEKAAAIIQSGTPFDVHGRVFKTGECAQTRFGSASILLCKHADDPQFSIQVRWSFAEYLWIYLTKVARYV